MSTQTTEQKLKQIIDDIPISLKAEVAREALDHEDVACFFKDLAQGGCISGMVGNLIYYSDTTKFYDKHYHEIEQLRTDFEEETGQPLQPNGDLKNWYAWFAFEQTAFTLATELGICL